MIGDVAMVVEEFIARWSGAQGSERGEAQAFLLDLCDLLGVERPGSRDYAFEYAIASRFCDEAAMRADLYKRNHFVLEAKSARRATHTARGRGGDAALRRARRQAEWYVHRLGPDHLAPPFLIVCEVGRALEVYADFSGAGRGFTYFPGRSDYRIELEDLRRPAVLARLRSIWTDPFSLDPSRREAAVTRQVSEDLETPARNLAARLSTDKAYLVLVRCIFCMFAEDVGLLPRGAFTALLQEGLKDPMVLSSQLGDLWWRMSDPRADARFYPTFGAHLLYFGGSLFRDEDPVNVPLDRPTVEGLLRAARHDWRHVDPAIFGALLEKLLKPRERRRMGAHYTPRIYVEQLVERVVMQPLSREWREALRQAEAVLEEEGLQSALKVVKGFHKRLCAIRVLDPACGTANFLYVALEMMKALEAKVFETLAELGQPEHMQLDGETVGPHQFLGLELDARAAAVAQLVIWIGYLQQHYRHRSGHPAEPILPDRSTINWGEERGINALVTCDLFETPGGRSGVAAFPNAGQTPWPKADFIVGNPPFMGGKNLRSGLEPDYAEALWTAYPHINRSADLCMYFWDRAAELAVREEVIRFGFVTTNSITQTFQRRVVERRLMGAAPISLVWAVADHPWIPGSGAAAVRVAMTVAEAGRSAGVLARVVDEADVGAGTPKVVLQERPGRINANLTIGADVTEAAPLSANAGLCSPGVKLHGEGFIISRADAVRLGLGRRPGLERHIRRYRHGRDVNGLSRDAMVIDLFGLEEAQVRRVYPEVYQHLLATVRPERAKNPRVSYAAAWWVFGEPRRELRAALKGLRRYIVTTESAKHRIFSFLDADILADNKLICFATDDAFHLGVLQSRIHRAWFVANSAKLGVYAEDAVYVKSRCFDPFPFPEAHTALRAEVRATAESLVAARNALQDERPGLTLTQIYNAMTQGSEARPDWAASLSALHDALDEAVARAYGWSADLDAADIIERLVELNRERAAAEACGVVRWLRADLRGEAPFRAPQPVLSLVPPSPMAPPAKIRFPRLLEQPLAVERALDGIDGPATAEQVASRFSHVRLARVAKALDTLARYGWIIQLPDGRYLSRKVA